jgi:hypothetical protein
MRVLRRFSLSVTIAAARLEVLVGRASQQRDGKSRAYVVWACGWHQAVRFSRATGMCLLKGMLLADFR